MNLLQFSRRGLGRALFIGALLVSTPLAAQTYTAAPIPADNYTSDPYNFTGILTSPGRLGSGAVVKNPRVVYSAAHVVFDTDALDPWLNGVRWYRGWASGSQPSQSVGQLLRSYYYFAGYAAAALAQQNSRRSFSLDFVVHYAYENTANGGYAGSWNDGVSPLLSSRSKLITGYPAGNYASGDSRKYLMHSTGPFVRPFAVNTWDYLGISEVSTGPGNSGGPAWVSDGSQYLFAGVLVSGLERSTGGSTDAAGVYGVDSSSAALIDAAIGAGGGAVVAPTITAQPTSRRVAVGQSASFTVSASGTSLGYRWLFNGAAISGATSATFTLNAVSLAHAGTYQAIVSNAGGEARSTVATLAVDSVPSAPVISTQPASLAVAVGQTASFTVAVTGTLPLTYQWQKNGTAISGATSATLTVSNAQLSNAGSYSVMVTNAAGSLTSNSAVLTVNVLPAITTQPASQTVKTGQSVVLSVAATGTPPPTYQWKRNGLTLSGATGATLTIANVQSANAGSYVVVVTNSVGTVTSTPATLTVNPVGSGVVARLAVSGAPVYTPAGGNITLAGTLTYTGLTPTALGYTINLPTGWTLVSTSGPNTPSTAPAAGATDALEFAYTSFPSGQASFTVVVSYPAGLTGNQTIGASAIYRTPLQTLTIPSLVLTRVEPPVITTQPANKVAVVGASVTFTVSATSSARLSYQWQKAGTAIFGATTSTLTLTNVQLAAAASYSVVVSNVAGSVTSSAATLTVIDVRATHAGSGPGSTAGGTVTITNTLIYTGTATSLGWQVLLPTAWSYASGGSSEGDVKPAAGTTSLLDWAWTTIPASPLTFTYTLNVPAGTTGDQQLAALVLFRQSGNLVQFLATPDPLVVSQVTTHSGDTDRNFRLSLLELTRVIEVYNTRNGTTRTGTYKVEAGSEDGFAPEPTRASSAVVTLTQYHSADSDRNGKLNLLELTRVIELYNTRAGTVRTGAYRAQAGTEDGYAPGP